MPKSSKKKSKSADAGKNIYTGKLEVTRSGMGFVSGGGWGKSETGSGIYYEQGQGRGSGGRWRGLPSWVPGRGWGIRTGDFALEENNEKGRENARGILGAQGWH